MYLLGFKNVLYVLVMRLVTYHMLVRNTNSVVIFNFIKIIVLKCFIILRALSKQVLRRAAEETAPYS